MSYDYVIVGAGAAGCVLAARLSEDPATAVLLLEAGPPDRKLEIGTPAAFGKLFGSEVDWGYATVPAGEVAGRSVYWPRGRTLGGSSSINAQSYVRGDRTDFDGWAAAGNPGRSRRRPVAGQTTTDGTVALRQRAYSPGPKVRRQDRSSLEIRNNRASKCLLRGFWSSR